MARDGGRPVGDSGGCVVPERPGRRALQRGVGDLNSLRYERQQQIFFLEALARCDDNPRHHAVVFGGSQYPGHRAAAGVVGVAMQWRPIFSPSALTGARAPGIRQPCMRNIATGVAQVAISPQFAMSILSIAGVMGRWLGSLVLRGWVLQITQHVARDHGLLDLCGALVDAEKSHVSIEAFDGVFAHVARAAEDLHSAVGHAPTHLGGKHLGT